MRRVISVDRLLSFLRGIESYPKRYIGMAAGFFCWLFIELFGLLPTLLLAVLVVIGYSVGRMADTRERWQDMIERFWDPDRFDR